MALRENIDAFKKELSSQEQLLESIFRGERFFKRNKYKLIVFIVVIVGFVIAYVFLENLKTRNLHISNKAYIELQNNPDNQELIEVLKNKNKQLYRLFTFKQAIANNNTEVLKNLISEDKTDIIADLSLYLLDESANNSVLENYIKLQNGYKLLMNGNTSEADLLLKTIATNNFQFLEIVNAVGHYQFYKNQE